MTQSENNGKIITGQENKRKNQGGVTMQVKNIYALNWLMYKQYCHRTGETEGNFKTFKKYMEGKKC